MSKAKNIKVEKPKEPEEPEELEGMLEESVQTDQVDHTYGKKSDGGRW